MKDRVMNNKPTGKRYKSVESMLKDSKTNKNVIRKFNRHKFKSFIAECIDNDYKVSIGNDCIGGYFHFNRDYLYIYRDITEWIFNMYSNINNKYVYKFNITQDFTVMQYGTKKESTCLCVRDVNRHIIVLTFYYDSPKEVDLSKYA